MNRTRHLVDILATGALRPNRIELDFGLIDRKRRRQSHSCKYRVFRSVAQAAPEAAQQGCERVRLLDGTQMRGV
jgi:hypothetical protein